VKGKIDQSLAHGLPLVAARVTAEGRNMEDGEPVLIADDARVFTESVVRLYGDAELRNRLSKGGFELMEEHLSFSGRGAL
jgi:hypothetical protein